MFGCTTNREIGERELFARESEVTGAYRQAVIEGAKSRLAGRTYLTIYDWWAGVLPRAYVAEVLTANLERRQVG